MSFKVPEKFRMTHCGHLSTTAADGNNGIFEVLLRRGQKVFVIASDGGGWEHVSVSRKDRTPTWEEMCQVKEMFWSPEDCVIQFHPPRTDYVNNHPYCLHLWRATGQEFPRPPAWMIGVKEAA